jgi:hypothetical protein
MDKRDKIILWFALVLVLQTMPTWFHFGWYWFDLSTATIIAFLVLCLSFLVKQYFLEYFLIYIYFIKLTNIISLYADYGNSTYLYLLNYSKPILNVVLYIWFIYVFTKYVKGWKYEDQ